MEQFPDKKDAIKKLFIKVDYQITIEGHISSAKMYLKMALFSYAHKKRKIVHTQP
jgi:hypothetical protein